VQVLGAGGALGGPARPDVNFVGKTANLGAAPLDWGFANNGGSDGGVTGRAARRRPDRMADNPPDPH